MLRMFVDAKAKIWGCEAHACSIIYDGVNTTISNEGKYYAECESSLETRRLTKDNYLEVLNDMFYNYCIKNASYMGVS